MSRHHDGLPVDSIVKKEEIQPSERERKWESHSSTSQAQTQVLTREDVIEFTEDKQLVDALKAIKINISRTEEKPNETKERVKLQKVPEIMRNGVLKEYIKPRELSIGPIHAADPNLYKKELKLKLAAHFIEKRGSTGEVLLEKMKSEITDIKMYFAKEVIESYTDEELLRLVFLDGCAMLGFIHIYVNKKLDIFNISTGQAALIQQDFFLLENQIPFGVLDVLLDKGESKNAEDLIDDRLIKQFTISSAVMSLNINGTRTESMPEHILDLQRRMLSNFTDLHSHRCYGHHMRREIRRCFCCCWCCGVGILVGLGMLIYKAIKRLNKPYDLPEQWSNMHSFRNVQELKAAGIKFKPTDSLETITFRSQFMIRGQLLLPTLVVDNSTAPLLLNLVAYEMCLSSHDYAVTSYVNLLDLLVDNEQDVKDLRAASIIRNFLSSDTAAAQLINSIGSNCFPPTVDKYEHVKYNIDKHYKRRCAIWIAQVYHAHFSSPLTVLALVAAAIVLVLTAVQTWYAIHPKN